MPYEYDFSEERISTDALSLDYDPPEPIVDRAINFFPYFACAHVARAGQVRPVRFPLVTWRMRYLNDDESELKEEAGLVRGRGV